VASTGAGDTPNCSAAGGACGEAADLFGRRPCASRRASPHGLVENPTGFGGFTVCRVTALGFEVLAVLREYTGG